MLKQIKEKSACGFKTNKIFVLKQNNYKTPVKGLEHTTLFRPKGSSGDAIICNRKNDDNNNKHFTAVYLPALFQKIDYYQFLSKKNK